MTLKKSFRPDSTPLAGWLIVAMPLVALPVRWFLIAHYLYPGNTSVYDIGFGFGDYVRSLATSGQFRSCNTLPFIACHPAVCAVATRMPVIPLLYASIAAAVGTHAASVAMVKSTLLALCTAGFLRAATRDLAVSMAGAAVLYLLYFGLQPLKHGASMEYEEGLMIDLGLCLAVAVLYSVRRDMPLSDRRRAAMGVAAVLIATLMYFTKTTALLTLSVIFLMTATSPWFSWRTKSVCAVLVLVPFAFWVDHNHAASPGIHFSSSWNGENLLRGYNSGAAAIYPEIGLDRAFDSTRAILSNGSVVALGNFSNRKCFDDEWTWNDYYAGEARAWVKSHVTDALAFDLRKAWVVFVEVREVPMYLSATDKTPLYPAGVRAAMIGWMVFARIMFFSLLVMVVLAIRDPQRRQYLWTILILGAACAPHVIVFCWQRHTVPILLMAGTWFVFLFMAVPRQVLRPDMSSIESERMAAR